MISSFQKNKKYESDCEFILKPAGGDRRGTPLVGLEIIVLLLPKQLHFIASFDNRLQKQPLIITGLTLQ